MAVMNKNWRAEGNFLEADLDNDVHSSALGNVESKNMQNQAAANFLI
jgi:hypothetical protein